MLSKLDTVEKVMRVQILQAAMLHSDVGAFECVTSDRRGGHSLLSKSTEFVAKVLGSFMQGLGHRVDGGCEAYVDGACKGPAAFREMLGAQIHRLTGQHPRWGAAETNGDYVIYQK